MTASPKTFHVGNGSDFHIFDSLVESNLGIYVYALFDPGNGEIFYIGKGGGTSQRGNSRLLDHFKEAKQLKVAKKSHSKVAKIRSIWATQRDVGWKILRRNIESESVALQIEATLIDTLRDQSFKLTNVQSGQGSTNNGILTPHDLKALAAKPIGQDEWVPSLSNRLVFLFNIEKGLKERANEPETCRFINATCNSWVVAEKWRIQTNGIALGAVGGVVRTALSIKYWQHDKANSKVNSSRWKIEHGSLHPQEHKMLEFKGIRSIISENAHWKYGNFLVLKFDQHGNWDILKGKPKDNVGQA